MTRRFYTQGNGRQEKLKKNESFIEVEVWDGEEFYATAFGPRDYVAIEVKNYARALSEHYGDDVRFMKVVRTPITLEEIAGEEHEG